MTKKTSKKKAVQLAWRRGLKSLYRRTQPVRHYVTQHPMLVAAGLYVAYFAIFQVRFLLSTDVWAETHMEYVDEAIKQDFWETFTYGWAGYLTFLPSLAAKLYVLSHLPLGYIDVFFQIIIVAFAILATAYLASSFNRSLLRFDAYRILVGLTILLLLHEKSTFSIINVWYLGFVPLVFICLNPSKLSRLKQLWYTLFGVLMALTKPSVFLVPFLVYRAMKTREWLSNVLIAAAAGIQTWVMLTLDPREAASNATHDLVLILKAVFVGGATELYKLFRIVPESYAYIIIANAVLLGLLILVWRRLGLIRAGLLLLGYGYSVYSYILAPDAVVYSSPDSYQAIYGYNFKIQREYLIYAFLVLIIFFALPTLRQLAEQVVRRPWPRRLVALILGVAACGIVGRLYLPIDVQSAGVAANISSFRNSLNSGQSVCVPLPPTPAYFEHSVWHFDFNTTCVPQNFEFTPDYKHLDVPLQSGVAFSIPNNTEQPIKTVYVVVRNEQPDRPALLTLADRVGGQEYFAVVPARSKEQVNFIPINVAGMPYRPIYRFTLDSDNTHMSWGRFKETGNYAYYPFFAATRAPLFSR